MTRLWRLPGVRPSAVVLLLMGTIAFCSAARDSGTSAPAAAKYTQTWAKPYSQTTCDEFMNMMSAQQRFAASADMLSGARNKGDAATGLPPDALIQTFSGGIDNSCVIPTMSLAETAAMLYLTDRERFRP